MLCFVLFSVACLLLAAIPDEPWQGATPTATVVGLYLVCFCCARWSRTETWQQKVIVDYEKVEVGFFGDDGCYFIPTYQHEQTWQLLLLGLPCAALLIFRLVRREHNRPLRQHLKCFFLLYGMAVMYGTNHNWFPGPVQKPAFSNPELTTPSPIGLNTRQELF